MIQQDRTYSSSLGYSFKAKLEDYKQLVKLRLTSTVVFSAVIGFFLAASGPIDWFNLVLIGLAGFLITGSANALNEIIEKDYDKLMKRTANRPLPTNRMSTVEALLFAGLMGVAGIFILAYQFNYLAALIGALSLLSYAFIYTPLKRISSIAVFVGAIPGALPPMIGWVAYTGSITIEAFILFSIQFLWQFPHFWAIAWVSHDDYSKAGFQLLPSDGGRTKQSAFYNIVYILFLIPTSLLPYFMGFSGWVSAIIIVLVGLVFLIQAYRLFVTCENKAAVKLMLGSFVYLPVVLLALVFDKV